MPETTSRVIAEPEGLEPVPVEMLEWDRLTANMKRFVSAIDSPEKSFTQATREAEISTGTLYNWMNKPGMEYRHFRGFLREKLKDVDAAQRQEFSPDDMLRSELRPQAFRRMREILRLEVDSETPAAKINSIFVAAKEVLQATGDLSGGAPKVNITVMVAQHAREGVSYRAPWQAVEEKPLVEVKALAE